MLEFILFLAIVFGICVSFALVFSVIDCLTSVSSYYKKKTELLKNKP